jgi:hypothetical protein
MGGEAVSLLDDGVIAVALPRPGSLSPILRFWLTVTNGLKGFVVGLCSVRARDNASDVTAEMGGRVGGYLRGVAINTEHPRRMATAAAVRAETARRRDAFAGLALHS